MTRTLTTGGTGFVGRFIVEDLLAAGHEVVVCGRTAPSENFFSKPVRFVAGSLEQDRIDVSIFADVDTFIHAAFDHVPGKYRGGEGDDPGGFVRRNRDGSITLFEAAKTAGVRRAVFLSTRAVYGPKLAGTVLTEDAPATPDTLYGQVKRDVEKAVLATADRDFVPVVLRVTGVYGPAGPGRQHKWSGLFADYLSGKTIVPRAGTEVHGENVARAVRLAIDHADPTQILNVSDIMVDRHDLLAIVKAATKSTHPLPERADVSTINEMDCTKLKALGWKPGGWTLLERSVRDLV